MCLLFAPVLSFCSFPLSISFHHTKKISFPLSSNEQTSFAPFFDLHHTTQSCIMLDSSSQLFFLVLIGSPILLLLVLPPRRVDLLVLPTERKEGQTSIRKIHSLHSSFLISQTTIVVFKINSSFIFFQNHHLTILKLLE